MARALSHSSAAPAGGKDRPRILAVTLLSALLAACSSGSASSGPGALTSGSFGSSTGASNSTAMVTGPISKLNGEQLIVEDMLFSTGVASPSTGSATVTVEGEPARAGDLAMGQVVTVLGPAGVGGTATAIDIKRQVRGAVTAVSAAQDRIVVLGQTVILDGSTVLDIEGPSGEPEALKVGDIVDVSGLPEPTGAWLAGRIASVPDGGPEDSYVVGTVSSLDTAAQTFRINTLSVSYASATLSGFTNGLRAGDQVEVTGAAGPANTLMATAVRPRTARPAPVPNGWLVVSGVATGLSGSMDLQFTLAGYAVMAPAASLPSGGVTENAVVQVRGRLDPTGVVHAMSVAVLERAATAYLEGPVTGVARGQLQLLGMAVASNRWTQTFDSSEATLEPTVRQPIDLPDLKAGDYVTVWQFQDGTIASIVRHPPANPGEVQVGGFLDHGANPRLVLSTGQPVLTTPTTQYFEGQPEPGGTCSCVPSGFWGTSAAVVQGSPIEVIGTFDGQAVVADRLYWEWPV